MQSTLGGRERNTKRSKIEAKTSAQKKGLENTHNKRADHGGLLKKKEKGLGVLDREPMRT